VKWQPLIYQDGPRGQEYDKQCKHTITSECGKYRISRGKSGEQWRYHAWVSGETPPAQTLYSSGSSRRHCIGVYDTGEAAKQRIADYAAG